MAQTSGIDQIAEEIGDQIEEEDGEFAAGFVVSMEQVEGKAAERLPFFIPGTTGRLQPGGGK